MSKRITTTDDLATLHVDREQWDLWVDVQPSATPKTLAEVADIAEAEGCYVMYDECEAEHIEEGKVRYYLGYLEVVECP